MYTIAPENTWATRYQLHKDEQLLGTIVTSGWMSVYTITLPDDEIVLKKPEMVFLGRQRGPQWRAGGHRNACYLQLQAGSADSV